MTPQTYNDLASDIRRTHEMMIEAWGERTADAFHAAYMRPILDNLKRDNPRFDRLKFMEAAAHPH